MSNAGVCIVSRRREKFDMSITKIVKKMEEGAV
jgi:hypothetical protein